MDFSRLAFMLYLASSFSTISCSVKGACEGNDVSISCLANQVILLSSATYKGLASALRQCPSPPVADPSCSSLDVREAVEAACEFQKSCSISSSYVVFGRDPCPGKVKYLEITYKCRSAVGAQSPPTLTRVSSSSATMTWPKHSLYDYYQVERKAVPDVPGAVPGKHFKGDGYVEFQSGVFSGGKTFTISLSFRTTQEDGLIFFAGRDGDDDDGLEYVALYMNSGFLNYQYSNNAPSIVKLSSSRRLDDGEWHRIVALKDGKMGQLTVDDKIFPGGSTAFHSSEVDVSTIYIGGFPSTASTGYSVFPSPYSFAGCLYNVSLAGQELDWSKNFSYSPNRWDDVGCPVLPQKGYLFRGNGYVSVPSSRLGSGSYLSFGMELRTTWPYGLLMALIDDKRSSSHFFFLEIDGSSMVMNFNNGSGAVGRAEANFKQQRVILCDGLWHRIDVVTNATHLTIGIDQQAMAFKHGSAASTLGLTFNSFVFNYVGGLPADADDTALKYGVNTNGFSGCLKNFSSGGKTIDFRSQGASTFTEVSAGGCSTGSVRGRCDDGHAVSPPLKTNQETEVKNLYPFSEYLFRILVTTKPSGVISRSDWIVVRTGESDPVGLLSPKVNVNGTSVSLKWMSPTFPNGLLSYSLSVYYGYPGSASVKVWVKVFVPLLNEDQYDLNDLAPRTEYTFLLTARTGNGSVTADPVIVETADPYNCYRLKDKGVSYRGRTSTSKDGSPCLNWAHLIVYDQLKARYPESGLGDHSFCRNPIAENRTMPWCYTKRSGVCLTWEYCAMDVCYDKKCYSKIDDGYGYRGSQSQSSQGFSCANWSTRNEYPVQNYIDAGLGNHSHCRNPSGLLSGPWCYAPSFSRSGRTCGLSSCEDFPSIPSTCEGGTQKGPCIFPFVYKNKRFVECTTYERSTPWCATQVDTATYKMTKWAYCLCPASSVVSSTELPPLKTNTLDGTCPNGQMSTPSAETSTPSAVASTPSAVTFTPTSTSSVSTTSATSTTREAAKATAVAHSASATDRVTPTASDFTGSGSYSTPSTSFETEQYMMSSTTDTSVEEPSQGLSSTVWIAVGAGAGCVVLLIVTVIVVCVVLTRRRKGNVTVYQNEMIGVKNDCEESQESSKKSHVSARYSKAANVDDGYASVNFGVRNKLFEASNHSVESQSTTLKSTYWEVENAQASIPEEDLYWAPARTEDKLYDQFRSKRFRSLERGALHMLGVLGSGQFGSVEKATWNQTSSNQLTVAVKTLKSKSQEDRVKFLQEAAIMGQFKHDNVVALHGVVLTGELLVVLEFMPKGDVKEYLQSLSSTDIQPTLDKTFLRMAREIASGMTYLSEKAFVHRDLAARNVMLNEQLVCKIGDFGLSRDLADNTYYVTHGGKIPIRWTAPEAIHYRKYSCASDVWSYGIVLFEIWSVGSRPYPKERNRTLADRLESGYRMPPPPGCSRAIYQLMIACWHGDHHSRPKFSEIVAKLSEDEDSLLCNQEEPIAGQLGDGLQVSAGAYPDLQKAYAVYVG